MEVVAPMYSYEEVVELAYEASSLVDIEEKEKLERKETILLFLRLYLKRELLV